MRNTHTFSVDFIIRKCKGDKTHAYIYARITVDGELPKEICLKDKIKSDDWDNRAEQVRGRSIEVKTINDNIDEVRAEIKAQYKKLQQNHQLITAETVKNANYTNISIVVSLLIGILTNTLSPNRYQDGPINRTGLE